MAFGLTVLLNGLPLADVGDVRLELEVGSRDIATINSKPGGATPAAQLGSPVEIRFGSIVAIFRGVIVGIEPQFGAAVGWTIRSFSEGRRWDNPKTPLFQPPAAKVEKVAVRLFA